jgi:TBC1 domain family protein 5
MRRDGEESSIKEAKRGSVSGKGNTKSGKSAKGKYAPETEVEEEVIDLANMGKKGVI